MVFCAGLGTRMRELTAQQPKAMVPVCNTPLLAYRMEALEAAAIEHVVLNTHYKPVSLEAYMQENYPKALLCHEETLLDTAGGLLHAQPLLGMPEALFTINCDVIWQGKLLEQLQAAWNSDEMDVLMTMVPLEKAHGYHGTGDFSLQAGGALSRDNPTHVFGGVQIIKPKIVERYAKGREVFSLSEVYADIGKNTPLRAYGYEYNDLWLHVDSPEGVDMAEQYL